MNSENINLRTKENITIQIKTISLHRNLLSLKNKNELRDELKEILFSYENNSPRYF